MSKYIKIQQSFHNAYKEERNHLVKNIIEQSITTKSHLSTSTCITKIHKQASKTLPLLRMNLNHVKPYEKEHFLFKEVDLG